MCFTFEFSWIKKKQKKFLVVFDIDGVVCKPLESYPILPGYQCLIYNVNNFKLQHSECPNPITFIEKNKIHYYYFPPYLEVLFNYLIKSNCRIAFFSAAAEDRNIIILEKLLSETLGKEYYQQLKTSGQFDVFSSHHLRKGQESLREFHYAVKDLSIILKDNEDINNSILIEDQPCYAAYNTPCITGLNLYRWTISATNDSPFCFAKNNAYYLLGIFNDYFNNKQYLSFKEWSQKISLDKKPNDTNTPFVRDMILSGLQEVKKQHQNIIIYGIPQPLELDKDIRYKQHVS